MVPRSGDTAGFCRSGSHALLASIALVSLAATLMPGRAAAEANPVPVSGQAQPSFNFSSMADLARSIIGGGKPAANKSDAEQQPPKPAAPPPAPEPMAVGAPAPAKATAAKPVAAELKGDTERTRFVIRLPKKTSYHVSTMDRPHRLIVDVGSERLLLPPVPEGAPVGLVKGFRGGISGPGSSRIVIDVTAPVIVEDTTMRASRDGAELVLDIVPIGKGIRTAGRADVKGRMGAGAGTGLQPPMPRKAQSPKDQKRAIFKPIIVIDPGHGGHDSGAMKNGAVEKEVVLAFSLKLRQRLVATGRYQVLMTREDDRFIPLDERREFAERHKAALFIAVHADYANSNARGATIYSLRDGSAERLARSAKSEVASDVLTDGERQTLRKTAVDVSAVETILSDLAVRDVEATRGRTSIFTKAVIETMGKQTEMREQPDKQAAFAVLQTAKVPAVLIELAYVTNRQDAALLKSDEWRNKVSASIVTAIDNYFSHARARLPL